LGIAATRETAHHLILGTRPRPPVQLGPMMELVPATTVMWMALGMAATLELAPAATVATQETAHGNGPRPLQMTPPLEAVGSSGRSRLGPLLSHLSGE